MKFSKDDYNTVAQAIGNDMPLDATERQRWDSLWRAVDSGKLDFAVLRPYLDAHIGTALRHVYAGIVADDIGNRMTLEQHTEWDS